MRAVAAKKQQEVRGMRAVAEGREAVMEEPAQKGQTYEVELAKTMVLNVLMGVLGTSGVAVFVSPLPARMRRMRTWIRTQI